MQNFWVDHTYDVAQIEIAVDQFRDILATDFAKIAFVAFGHWKRVES